MNGDKNFRLILLLLVILLLALMLGIFGTLIYSSSPSIIKFGIDFLTGSTWDPVLGDFGSLPFLIGTLLTSFIALILSFPIAITIAILLGEYYKDGILNTFIKGSVELLAGIPSIVYGFWGLFILVPIIRDFQIQFGITPYGVGIFTSSIVLAIMIIPYSASIAYEVISMTPKDIKEAAYSLGATRFEVLTKIILPFSSSGIFAGVLLSLGRALGETMAVTMVIGNSNILPNSIFAPGNTMASIIANEFTEATDDVYLSALIEIGLVLLIVTAIINILGKFFIRKMSLS